MNFEYIEITYEPTGIRTHLLSCCCCRICGAYVCMCVYIYIMLINGDCGVLFACFNNEGRHTVMPLYTHNYFSLMPALTYMHAFGVHIIAKSHSRNQSDQRIVVCNWEVFLLKLMSLCAFQLQRRCASWRMDVRTVRLLCARRATCISCTIDRFVILCIICSAKLHSTLVSSTCMHGAYPYSRRRRCRCEGK